MEAKFFIKGPKMSNQASNLTSQRMVTESRFMTLLSYQIFYAPRLLVGRKSVNHLLPGILVMSDFDK